MTLPGGEHHTDLHVQVGKVLGILEGFQARFLSIESDISEIQDDVKEIREARVAHESGEDNVRKQLQQTATLQEQLSQHCAVACPALSARLDEVERLVQENEPLLTKRGATKSLSVAGVIFVGTAAAASHVSDVVRDWFR
jgi:septal ring factor EnvC (AmiA/AmiB activator)